MSKKTFLRCDDPKFAAKVLELLNTSEISDDDFNEGSDDENQGFTDASLGQARGSQDPSEDDMEAEEELSSGEDDDVPAFSPQSSDMEVDSEEFSDGDRSHEVIPLHPALPVGLASSSSSQGNASTLIFTAKSGMKWSSQEPDRRGRPPARNILKCKLPGATPYAKNRLGTEPSELDVWQQFIDPEMVANIHKFTTMHLIRAKERSSKMNIRNYYETTVNEINALIGLFLLTSIYKSNKESSKSLFASGVKGRPIFRAVMSYRRFTVLKEALRFDDPATRDERRKTDRAAPISEMFSKLVINSQLMYTIGDRCTVDESLLPFRGRVGFRIYMPNKPGKYGIKLMVLSDARTSYFYNAYIYTGKGSDGKDLTEEERKLSVPTQSLITLSTPIQRSNRNITADNWFSSVEAVIELKKRGLTYVGTMRKNKRDLPAEFTTTKNRRLNDKMFGFSMDENKITLFSSKVKSTKVLNIISSMHQSKGYEEGGKAEMNIFYNETKNGVDSLDYRCALYSCQRKDERWPMCVFSGMLNIAMVNAFIVHKCFAFSALEPRFCFIEKLAFQLIESHLRDRLDNPRINKDVKMLIRKALKMDPAPSSSMDQRQLAEDRLQKKKYCFLCPYYLRRYTNYMCVQCKKPVCLQCSRKTCLPCLQKTPNSP